MECEEWRKEGFLNRFFSFNNGIREEGDLVGFVLFFLEMSIMNLNDRLQVI